MSHRPPAASIRDSAGVKRRGRQGSALAGSAGILVKDQIVQIRRGIGIVVWHGLLLSWGSLGRRRADWELPQKDCLTVYSASNKKSA